MLFLLLLLWKLTVMTSSQLEEAEEGRMPLQSTHLHYQRLWFEAFLLFPCHASVLMQLHSIRKIS
jgi:hypothetical protein